MKRVENFFPKSMNFQDLQHDAAVLTELGRRLAQRRIAMNMTQAELARQAGIGKRTLERMEAGETTQTRTFFRVIRELDLLVKLALLLPEPTLGPGRSQEEGEVGRKRAARKKPAPPNAEEESRKTEEDIPSDPADDIQGMLGLDGF